MTRFQTIMKQIAKLASEAAGMSTGEEHFAARDIKYAAEAAASISHQKPSEEVRGWKMASHD